MSKQKKCNKKHKKRTIVDGYKITSIGVNVVKFIYYSILIYTSLI